MSRKWFGTIIGGGIGWALLGPLGALIGAYIGSMFDSSSSPRTKEYSYDYDVSTDNQFQKFGDTRAGDFAIAMLSLFAYITKADKKTLSSEVRYVKKFLIEKFGVENAQDLLYLYREILNKNFDIKEIAKQIRNYMDYYSRLELLHVLFGIAGADGEYHQSELKALEEIALELGITAQDYNSIRSMFVKQGNYAYEILGVCPEDDIETIKKAYREMASKYHPDKVSHLGQEFQRLAEEKFKQINEAYQQIRQIKGF
ncbi:MAG: TerB family tellurite resistance protein [Candidatus Marinimicrobia bacterium]|nr:TerB family tellurite resistance protein [Candidatus Neomarinimicrobiota bacterium]